MEQLRNTLAAWLSIPRRRRYSPARHLVTFADGRTTVMEYRERYWEVDRLDEETGSTALYRTLREAKDSLRYAGATVAKLHR